MRAIMISIKPEWVEKILNGEKTIEIRKTIPKCELPCKVYIYCTKDKDKHLVNVIQYGGNFGYYCVHKNSLWRYKDIAYEGSKYLNGKVVAEFTLNKVEDFSVSSLRSDDIEKLACLSYKQMIDYFYKPEELDSRYSKQGYAWYIYDLKIYDKPKELSEFSAFISNNECNEDCQKCNAYNKEHNTCLACMNLYKPLKRPPQSWCYVEEVEK